MASTFKLVWLAALQGPLAIDSPALQRLQRLAFDLYD